MPGDLLLALAQVKAGEVPDLLAPHAEVGIDAGRGEARPEALEASRARGAVSLLPAAQASSRGRRREVSGNRRPPGRTGHWPYFWMFFRCWACVFA